MILVDILYSSLFILCFFFFLTFPLDGVIKPDKSNSFFFLTGFLCNFCVYWTSSSVKKTIRRGTQWDADKARRPTDLPVKTCGSFLESPFRDNYWIPFSLRKHFSLGIRSVWWSFANNFLLFCLYLCLLIYLCILLYGKKSFLLYGFGLV